MKKFTVSVVLTVMYVVILHAFAFFVVAPLVDITVIQALVYTAIGGLAVLFAKDNIRSES